MNLPLGKPSAYRDEYDPELLCPFPRRPAHGTRLAEALRSVVLMFGMPTNSLGWLRRHAGGGHGEFRFPCTSTFLIESKSLSFISILSTRLLCRFARVAAVLERDCLGQRRTVAITLKPLGPAAVGHRRPSGRCLTIST